MKTQLPFSKCALYLAAFVLAVSAQIVLCSDYPTTLLSFNPVGYYRLSEVISPPGANILVNSGSLGAAGNAYPTPYGVTVPANQLLYGQPGVVGNAIAMTNPAPVNGNWDSAVAIPYNDAWNPPPGTPFTVEVWANPNAHNLTSGADLLTPAFSLDINKSRSGWLLYYSPAGSTGIGARSWNFRMGGLASYAVNIASPAGSGVIGAWNHVVCVYDGTNALLYVGGQLAAGPSPVNLGAGYNPNRAQPFYFGMTSFAVYPGVGSGRTFDGMVDEVAFYSTALSANVISNHNFTATNSPGSYSALVMTSAPVGYWHLDEPTYVPPDPSTLPTTPNIGTLGSPNGTNYPGLTSGYPGPSGAGFGANNVGIQTTYAAGNVSLGNPDGLNFTNQITMMAWVKPQYTDGLRNILAHGYVNTPANEEVQMRINAGNYECGSWSPGEGALDTNGLANLDTGNWVFLAATFDGNTNWNLYRYDQLLTSNPGANGAIQVAADWSIGSRGDPTTDGRFFGGGIDEVAIFTNALTLAQIQSIFNSSLMPPQFFVKPAWPPGNVFSGDSLTLTMSGVGVAPLSYAWYKGTTLVGSGTSYSIPSLSTGNSGTYSAVISNPYGSVTNSSTITVVNPPPTVTQNPTSATRFVGASVTFSVAAIGPAPLSYQWYYNTNTSLGASATATSFTKGPLALGDAGKYNCKVTNPNGTTPSGYATLTMVNAPSAAYPVAVMADNPVAFYRLNETSGTVAHDDWGGHDGTYHSVTLNQPGYLNPTDPDPAVSFSGTNTYIGQISGLDFSGSLPFSLEAWVKGPAAQPSVNGTVISKGRGANGGGGVNGMQYSLQLNGGVWGFHMESSSGNTTVVDVNSSISPNGTWQHLVATYDGTAMSLYVNGTLAATGTGPDNGPLATALGTSIGVSQSGVTPIQDQYFLGSIDEVAVYNVALSASQVHTHYCTIYAGGGAPSIVAQPASVTQWVGWPIVMTVQGAGACDIIYQWKRGGVNVTDDGNLVGSQTPVLAITNVDSSYAGNYTVSLAKGAITTNSQIAVLTVLNTPTEPVAISGGMIMHLKFDDSLTDSSGHGNSGTGKHTFGGSSTSGGQTTTGFTPPAYPGGNSGPFGFSDGKLGHALHYSSDTGLAPQSAPSAGYGTNDYWVALGVRPDLKFDTNVNFSVAYWVKLPFLYDLGDLPFFDDVVNSTFGTGYTFAPAYGSNALYGASGNLNSGGWAWSLDGTGVYGPWLSIADGSWHSLVHTFNRAANAHTYLDGVLVDVRSVAGLNILNNNQAAVGQDPTGAYAESGSADIDDLGVWRRELSATEALGIYVAGTNNLSFVDLNPIVTPGPGAGQVTVTWQAGTLQAAGLVTGPYTNTPYSSPYTFTPTGPALFYRVHQQ